MLKQLRVCEARGAMAAGCIGLSLLFSVKPASAAMVGSLGSSVGLFAALVALLAAKAWPVGFSAGAVSTAAALVLLMLLAGGALLRRGVRLPVLPRLTRARVAPARAVGGSPIGPLPAGFEHESVLAMARQHFVQLQAAWDAGDVGTLHALTTADMLDELQAQLPERGAGVNCTDVVTLHAELLGFEEWASAYVASVEFSGLIRENADQGPAPFRELWMLARAKDADAGWRLARHQALL